MTNQHWLETYKSLIGISIEGFKFSALANGGAAVALLAYLGNIASNCSVAPDMRYPMAAFLSGLVFCGFAMVFAYLTQLRLLNEIGRVQKPTITHAWFLWAALMLFALSLIAFGVGSWLSVVNFR